MGVLRLCHQPPARRPRRRSPRLWTPAPQRRCSPPRRFLKRQRSSRRQALLLPPTSTPAPLPTTHTVASGENLYRIALRYGLTTAQLAAANGILNPNSVYAGQVLRIPSPAKWRRPSRRVNRSTPQPAFPAGRKRLSSASPSNTCGPTAATGSCIRSSLRPGLATSPTAPGTYRVLDKIPNAYASTWNLQMPYWLGIYYVGRIENGIHALPILSSGQTLWAGLLGRPASFGCVILDTASAKALYDWADAWNTGGHSAMTTKTNAMRVLDQRKIPYEVHEYSPEIHSAMEAALAMGRPVERVYKTLVVMRDARAQAKPLLVMVPGDRELDLRELARSTGDKKLRMATQKEAESLTGLLVGGIGALALLNRGFEIWIDPDARAHERICVNAGQRGINLELRVDDLVQVTGARWFKRE